MTKGWSDAADLDRIDVLAGRVRNSRVDARPDRPRYLATLVALLVALAAWPAAAQQEQPPAAVAHKMELRKEERAWYRNPDGSCVQCSIGMCGVWTGDLNAASLLWDTEYGKRERGGSWPSRVSEYCNRRQIQAWNVTGAETWDWMRWAAKTGRFAAIGAGSSHFQTLYGWDAQSNEWYVCNNNSTHKVDRYSWEAFRRLHLASGQWVVVLKSSVPEVPQYYPWWEN